MTEKTEHLMCQGKEGGRCLYCGAHDTDAGFTSICPGDARRQGITQKLRTPTPKPLSITLHTQPDHIHPNLQGDHPGHIHIPAPLWAMLNRHVLNPFSPRGYITPEALTYLSEHIVAYTTTATPPTSTHRKTDD